MSSRNNKIKLSGVLILFFLMLFSCGGTKNTAPAGTPVAEYGALQIIGNQLCDSKGNPVQLKGMSSMDINWFGEYSNADCLSFLRDDWNCSIYRGSMYTLNDGHFVVPQKIDDMHKTVQAAIEAGIYVIIDWHILLDGNPLEYKDEAVEFFSMMAEEYKGVPNVLYEICNEPNGDDVHWNTEVRPYAVEVIKAIRKKDKKAIILVGNPEWCQRLDAVVANPLEGDNIAYVLHFYAGDHGDSLRRQVDDAQNAGLAVFVTEWGTTRASGDGGVYPYQTMVWIDFLNERNVSWANWSISTRDEDSAALRHTAHPRGNWDDGDISDSGLLTRMLLRDEKRATLFADGFETESFRAGDWERDNTGIVRNEAANGTIAARFRKQNSLTKVYSTQKLSDAEIVFSYKTKNLEEGDNFMVQWDNGREWETAWEVSPADDWTTISLPLPEKANNNIRFKFRFIADCQGDSQILVDDVRFILSR